MTMLLFTAFAGVALTAAYVLIPYFKIAKFEQRSRRAENISIYKQRLLELESDIKLGKLDKEQFDIAEAELKQTLLSDVAEETSIVGQGNTIAFVTGLCLILVIVLGGYLWLGGAPQVDRWQQAQSRLPELGYRVVMQNGEPLSERELEDFALGLRTKLSRDPNDITAWLLLGRVNMSLRMVGQAMQAYEKALAIDPTHLGSSLSYAQALIISGEEGSLQNANRVLSRARTQHSDDVDLITLHAMVLSELGNISQAQRDWQWLLTKLDKDSPRYQSIEERLQALEGTSPASQAGSVAVSVTIEKAENVQTDNNVLFVFAKSVSGSPLPVAVKKLVGVSFPVTVSLSDADAMMTDMSLSQSGPVMITARLSADQDVMPSPDDWEGMSNAFDPREVAAITVAVTAPQGQAVANTLALTERQNPVTAVPANEVASNAEPANMSATDGSIVVTINKLDSISSEGKTLFVFAKAKDGPPMPVAVKKLTNVEFPVIVTLSDQDAMTPELSLSSQQQVIITARLSADGNVMPSAEDWEGVSGSVSPQSTSKVSLTINARQGQAVAEVSDANSVQVDSVSDMPNLSVKVDKAANVDTSNQVLFVFAKIPNGPPMPVAVKKLLDVNFPIEVTLSDMDAMLPTMKLSQQPAVILTARLSADEDVFAAAGEWEGQSEIIDPRSVSTVNVLINKEVN